MQKASGPILRPLAFLFSLAVTVAAGHLAHGEEIQLPDIGDSASSVLSASQETQLGQSILQEIRRNLPLVDDPLLNSYIQSLGYRLVSSSPDGNPYFTFLIVDDPNINAFATPGGIVAVNSGLILAATEEAELAAVIAHEIAHVTQRHLARLYAKGESINLATGLAILAAILASAYDSQLGQAAFYSTIAASAQTQINFTRANEQEADRIGMQTLINSGFDPRAMPSFFEKLQRLSFSNADSSTEYLRTHPVTTARISDSAARADQHAGQGVATSADFALMRARLRALKQPPQELLTAYEQSPKTQRRLEDHYLYALALINNDNFAQALAVLTPLAQDHPTRLPLRLAIAEALGKSGRQQEALTLLTQLNKLYPLQEPITLPLTQALLDTGRPAEALAIADLQSQQGHASPRVYQLKAEAASRANRPDLAHEALADYHILYGRYAAALEQLELGLKAEKSDNLTQARLRSKKETLNQLELFQRGQPPEKLTHISM